MRVLATTLIQGRTSRRSPAGWCDSGRIETLAAIAVQEPAMSLAIAEELSLTLIAVVGRPARPLPEGPGWFGSTWDLHQGLDVREGWLGDAALNGWIETWLSVAAAADCR